MANTTIATCLPMWMQVQVSIIVADALSFPIAFAVPMASSLRVAVCGTDQLRIVIICTYFAPFASPSSLTHALSSALNAVLCMGEIAVTCVLANIAEVLIPADTLAVHTILYAILVAICTGECTVSTGEAPQALARIAIHPSQRFYAYAILARRTLFNNCLHGAIFAHFSRPCCIAEARARTFIENAMASAPNSAVACEVPHRRTQAHP